MCGGPDCLQELLVTFLLVLCPSDKSPITAPEDEADTVDLAARASTDCGDQATAAVPSLMGHIL